MDESKIELLRIVIFGGRKHRILVQGLCCTDETETGLVFTALLLPPGRGQSTLILCCSVQAGDPLATAPATAP